LADLPLPSSLAKHAIRFEISDHDKQDNNPTAPSPPGKAIVYITKAGWTLLELCSLSKKKKASLVAQQRNITSRIKTESTAACLQPYFTLYD